MRLASFSVRGGPGRPGLILGDEIVDLGDPGTGLPDTMAELLALGPGALDQVRAAPAGGAVRHVLPDVRRHAPVPNPPAILAIGLNYRAHVAELGVEPPEWQYWFFSHVRTVKRVEECHTALSRGNRAGRGASRGRA